MNLLNGRKSGFIEEVIRSSWCVSNISFHLNTDPGLAFFDSEFRVVEWLFFVGRLSINPAGSTRLGQQPQVSFSCILPLMNPGGGWGTRGPCITIEGPIFKDSKIVNVPSQNYGIFLIFWGKLIIFSRKDFKTLVI